jgi:septum formation protein
MENMSGGQGPGRLAEFDTITAMRLILASGSARRAELLTAAGFTFEAMPADVDESVRNGEEPKAYALRVAADKADRIRDRVAASGEAVVLAADTVVVRDGTILGKPEDAADAARMLRTLSGGAHEVHTAVVIDRNGRRDTWIETTQVSFVQLSDAEIAWYVQSAEPLGKAGAYGIQGRAARFVERIEGSWSNVVGLPIATVYRLLKGLSEPD